MSSINKLSINGFRSYCTLKEAKSNPEDLSKAQDQQTVVFKRPLTLIWGHNGAGKTTIIECLKLAATGQHPPNSDRGKSFLTDSQLLQQTETQALVQLEFQSINGQELTVRRNFKVACNPNSLSISTLRSTIHYKHPQTGEQHSISNQCMEIDAKIPQLLGVSSSILTHVIFCHQEEQFWIFSDNQTLKKIFDELFETTAFAKLQDWIKDSLKIQTQELKKISDQIILAKRDVEDGARSREGTTREMLQIHNEAGKLRGLKEALDQVEKRCNPQEQKDLSQKISELQESITVNKYKVKENEEKIRGIDIPNNITEKKLNDERDNLSQQISRLKLELERTNLAIQRTEREIDAKKTEIIALDNGDNTENTIKQELKQLRLQAQQLINIQRNDSDELILKSLNQGLQTLQQRLKNINQDQTIKQLQGNKNSVSKQMNESSVNLQFHENNSTKLSNQLKQVQEKISKINQTINQPNNYERLQQDNKLKKQRLDEISDQYYEKQSQLSKVQKELSGINQQPIQEYKMLLKDLDEVKQQLQILDVKIGKKSVRHDTFEENKNSIYQQLQGAKNRSQLVHDKVSETRLKIQYNQAQLDEITSDIQKMPSSAKTLANTLAEVKQKYKTAKYELMKIQYSSGEFQDSFLQLSSQRKKCLVCNQGLDASDIQGIKDRRAKLQPKINVSIEEKQKILDQLKQERDELKKSCSQFSRFDELQAKLVSVTQIIQALEEFLFSQKKELHQLQDAQSQLQDQYDEIEKLYPLIAQRNHLSSRLDEIQWKLEVLTKQNPSVLNVENTTQALDELNLQQTQLYKELTDFAKQKEELQYQLKKQDQEMKQSEYQYQGQQRDKMRLPELLEQEKQLQLEIKLNQEQIVKTKADYQDFTNDLSYIEIQLQQSLEARDQQLEQINQELPLFQHIIPMYEKALEKLNEIRRSRKTNQNQFVQQQREQLQKELDEMEARQLRGGELVKKLESYLSASQPKLVSVEKQLEAIQIDKQNQSLLKEIQQALHSLQKCTATMDAIGNSIRDRDRLEAQLNAEKMKIQERLNRCNELKVEYENRFKNSEKKYMQLIFQEESQRALIEDLTKYQKEAELSLIQYHREKMEEINKSINETWQSIYEGEDIKNIYIRSDEDTTTSTKKNVKSYFYRIVMENKKGVEMDMRGRCSMGQKVLASIVIRLALSESFGNQCAVLTLDEPTTNLDRQHIKKLADSLSHLVDSMQQQQRPLQLIVITHDKEFIRFMRKFTTTYIKIEKKSNGFSKIEQDLIENI